MLIKKGNAERLAQKRRGCAQIKVREGASAKHEQLGSQSARPTILSPKVL
jgi:hypothetical protein